MKEFFRYVMMWLAIIALCDGLIWVWLGRIEYGTCAAVFAIALLELRETVKV